ncbi:MAG: UvrD-helicase domain-containing protein [Methanomassiliicoccales archaeon]
MRSVDTGSSGRAEFTELTPQQNSFVERFINRKSTLAISTAGSGKTTMLAMSIQRLLAAKQDKEGVLDRIVAVTFTNDAAYQLKKKVFEITGDLKVLEARYIGTIHSLCNSILKSNLRHTTLNPDYSILEEWQLEPLRQEAYKLLLEEKRKDPDFAELYSAFLRLGNWPTLENLLAQIHRLALQAGLSATQLREAHELGTNWLLRRPNLSGDVAILIERLSRALGETSIRYFDKIESLKEERGLLSFSDIIYRTWRLLQEHNEIATSFEKSTGYFLIDEFQDTDKLQNSILKRLIGNGVRAIVGDPLQAIYGWRGADPSILQDEMREAMERDRDSVISVNINHRSAPPLIHFFNDIIQHLFGNEAQSNRMQVWKGNMAVKGGVRIIRQQNCDASVDELRRNEAVQICVQIAKLIDEGMEPQQICILFRSSSAMHIYERELRAHQIPFVSQGGSLFETDVVLDLMTYLRHLVDPLNTLYIAASLRSPMFGAEDEVIVKISRDVSRIGDFAEASEAVRSFLSMDEFFGSNREKTASWVISEIIRRTSLEAVHALASGPAALANLLEFQRIVMELEDGRTVPVFEIMPLLETIYENGVPEATLNDPASKAVRLMTVHASKGLEFRVVFIADTIHGARLEDRPVSFDSERGMVCTILLKMANKDVYEAARDEIADEENSRREEEEKRLLYVAITRAREYLYLTSVEGGRVSGKGFNKYINQYLHVLLERGDMPDFLEFVTPQPHLPSGRQPERMGMPSVVEYECEPKELVITAAQLASLLSCHYRYVFRVRTVAMPPAQALKGMEKGSAVHEMLSVLHFQNPESSKVNGVGRAVESALAFFGHREVMKEFPFIMKEGRVTVRGKIDALALDGETAFIVDYKTGNIEGSKEEYLNQLRLYALFALKHWKLKEVLYQIIPVDSGQPFGGRLDTASAEELKGELNRIADELLLRNPSPAPSSSRCSHCTYRRMCEYSMADS